MVRFRRSTQLQSQPPVWRTALTQGREEKIVFEKKLRPVPFQSWYGTIGQVP